MFKHHVRVENVYADDPEGTRVRAEILKIHAVTPEVSLIKYAAEQIQAGQVLGMPTDTFYGLAADPFNLRAVERVYEIKSRLRHKPLSLLIENVDQAEEFARPLPDDFHLLARRFWPGPLTMIVPAASHLPLKVTANTGNVALRVPAAEIPLAVVRAAKIPITATSANLSGATECTTAEQVRDYIDNLHGWVGVNGVYDFSGQEQRGIGIEGMVLIRWDASKNEFVPNSRAGGARL